MVITVSLNKDHSRRPTATNHPLLIPALSSHVKVEIPTKMISAEFFCLHYLFLGHEGFFLVICLEFLQI